MTRTIDRILAICAVACVAALAIPATAEVADVAANGFEIQESVHIAATPDKVYAALIAPSHWWSSEHTYSGSAANMSLRAKAGGCWCEKLPGGGSVQHMMVIFAAPGKTLRLSGALGPFQAHAIAGAMTFSLKPSGNETDLTLTYDMAGYIRGGFADGPKSADAVLSQQMTRLKQYAETGSPDAHL